MTVATVYYAFSKLSESVMKMLVNGLVGAVLGEFSTSFSLNSNICPPVLLPDGKVKVAITVSTLRLHETVFTFVTPMQETLIGTVISDGRSNLNLSPEDTDSFVMI